MTPDNNDASISERTEARNRDQLLVERFQQLPVPIQAIVYALAVFFGGTAMGFIHYAISYHGLL
jgi:hypothetical protein